MCAASFIYSLYDISSFQDCWWIFCRSLTALRIADTVAWDEPGEEAQNHYLVFCTKLSTLERWTVLICFRYFFKSSAIRIMVTLNSWQYLEFMRRSIAESDGLVTKLLKRWKPQYFPKEGQVLETLGALGVAISRYEINFIKAWLDFTLDFVEPPSHTAFDWSCSLVANGTEIYAHDCTLLLDGLIVDVVQTTGGFSASGTASSSSVLSPSKAYGREACWAFIRTFLSRLSEMVFWVRVLMYGFVWLAFAIFWLNVVPNPLITLSWFFLDVR